MKKQWIRYNSCLIFSFVFVSFVFLLPYNSYASTCNLIGSGFSSMTAFNGTWTRSVDTYRSLPSFTKGSYYLAINPVAYDASLLYWIIDTTPESTGGFPYYKPYVDADGYVGNYTHNIEGSPTEGTMTLEDCEGGGGTATSTASSTTSTDQLLGSISFGITIIIVLLSMVSIGMLYNGITTKKPWL